jgi:uncharacterized membrane protein SpoIIM required for sporulation
MNIDEFISERKEEWERLESITKKLRPGSLQKLSRQDLWDLGRLYFAAVSDLSVLKSSELALGADNEIISYLNNQVASIHGLIYRTPRLTWATLIDFFISSFPRAFRAAGLYIATAAAVLIMAGLMGLLLGLKEPAFIELLVPENIIATVEKGKVWFKDLYTVAPMASSSLISHNISVTFLIFASGITFGVGTLYLLALNGLLIGTIAALCINHNLALEFWSFLLPHGSLELMSIFIAGGAGLVIGHALIDPGPYRRSEILALRSKQAAKLIAGCIPLLVMAGLIEAFVSPSPLPAALKIIFSMALFLALLGFLILSGAGLRKEGPPLTGK